MKLSPTIPLLDVRSSQLSAPPPRYTLGLLTALLLWLLALALAWNEDSAALAFIATLGCLLFLVRLQERLQRWRAERQSWLVPHRRLAREKPQLQSSAPAMAEP